MDQVANQSRYPLYVAVHENLAIYMASMRICMHAYAAGQLTMVCRSADLDQQESTLHGMSHEIEHQWIQRLRNFTCNS